MLPDDFVDLATLPALRFAIGYATPSNFTGAPLPGYDTAGAWLHRSAADALARVLERLARERLTLVVYDAYRPLRATEAMVAWCAAHGREDLFDGWIGRTSRHHHGVAIDVGLAWRESGAPLPMGGAWDAFGPESHFEGAVGAARANRRALRAAMVAEGFAPYWREWWHFERPTTPLPPARDAPYR
ncbi:MAG: D-alanyl-D-alanine carboxypeptidase family protein [Sandaracinaceae bacterium]|nr:D-alanyl-D-alanine carboxypeptidase family protein [Sandaracinaceae bacterium]